MITQVWNQNKMEKTENITLVPVSMQHVGTMYDLIKNDNKELSLWTTIPYPITKKKIKQYYQSAKKNDETIFTIKNKKTKELMGSIGFMYNARNNNAAIGYWVGKKFRNKGYVTQAVEKMLEYGFRKRKVNRIEITAMEKNTASNRVIEKIGFVYEGTLRLAGYNGLKQYNDIKIYSILKEEWEKNEN